MIFAFKDFTRLIRPNLFDSLNSGLEADQKVLASHGVYAMTATTALTAQNTLGVQDIHIVPPAFLGRQIDSVLDDVDLGDNGCVKIGELSSLSVSRAGRIL